MITTEKPLLSVVSPIYHGERMLQELVGRLISSLSTITDSFEIILVNDASPDYSWHEIEKVCVKDIRVKGINLSRNFGQHYAITAGLQYAFGEWVVVMDCDLQDQPEEIPRLYEKAQEGFDSVLAQRIERHDRVSKRLSSRLFYKLFSYLTDTKQDASIANFGIYNRRVINAVLDMGDAMRYLPTQVQWVGFKKAYLPIEHAERPNGKSSYTFKRLFRLAIDTIISFSDKPLRLMAQFGFTITALSLVAAVWLFINWLSGKTVVMGYTSIMISVWFFAGILISLLGIIGLYIGRMFEKVKSRPLYIISETRNVRVD